jgi:hypothetical protein
MKKFEIWVGYYHLGQGHHGSTQPLKLTEIKAIDFPTACIKYELRSMFNSIEEQEMNKGYVDSQSKEWFYNWRENRNSWTGKYYESYEEALKSFKND